VGSIPTASTRMTIATSLLGGDRRIYPPHWVAILAVSEAVVARLLPGYRLIPSPWNALGVLLAVLGLAFGGWAFALFRRAKTGIVPFTPATSLVLRGPYRFSRNPMYLGMALVLTGEAVVLGAVTAFLAPLAFVLIVTVRFIRPEEAQMEGTFGADYRELRRRVRRWL